MYFRVNLKMEKTMLCCCFTWIVFIELNFTVAFLLIRKPSNDWFPGKVVGWKILRNGGILVMVQRFWNGGVDTLLRTMLNILPKFWLIFRSHQKKIQKMSHLWYFNGHDSLKNDQIFLLYSLSFFSIALCIFSAF